MMIKKLLWKLVNSVEIRTLGLVKGLYFIFCGRSGVLKNFKADFKGNIVTIRSASNDLAICLENFSNTGIAELPPEEHFRTKIGGPNSRGIIIDAGGHIGSSAIALSKRYPNAQIVTIEPFFLNYILLRKNTSNFPNIIPIHAALTAQGSGISELRTRASLASLTVLKNPLDFPNGKIVEKVPNVNISDILRQHPQNNFWILKINIEGGEKEIFQDASSWKNSVQCIYAELHDRITPGCREAFLEVSKLMQSWPVGNHYECVIKNVEG
jgi:FkbM family methyltransferase